MVYEVLFFDGWGTDPAYYLLDSVEGDTPEDALAVSFQRVVQQDRRRFGLTQGEVSDRQIQETLYVVQENGLAPARDIVRLSSGGISRKGSDS